MLILVSSSFLCGIGVDLLTYYVLCQNHLRLHTPQNGLLLDEKKTNFDLQKTHFMELFHLFSILLHMCPIQYIYHVVQWQQINNWGGGGTLRIFVFIYCKNIQFQKKLMMQNTNI